MCFRQNMGIMNMKRLISILLMLVMLITLAACGKPSGVPNSYGFEDEPEENSSEYIVDNEDQAQKIITCSHKNLFGLEKIVLFNNKAVVIFDKKTSDKTRGFLGKGKNAVKYVTFSFNNLSPMETEFNVSKKDGKYILEADCRYEESDMIDPDISVKITRIFIKGQHDSMNVQIYADDLELNLYKENHDSFTQSYESAKTEWSGVEAEIYESETEVSMGVFFSYELDLTDYWNQDLECEADGVIYKITGYGYYLSLTIENTGEEVKTIAGTRYLQRVKDGVLIDLGRDRRETIYQHRKFKDLPVVKIWKMPSDDSEVSWQHGVDPDISLKENETIEIKPGQRYYVEILVEDFDVYKDGTYRLSFGKARLDFNLEWIVIS